MSIVNRRARAYQDSSSMGGILAPAARKVFPRNYHRENIQNMHKKELENKRRVDEEI